MQPLCSNKILSPTHFVNMLELLKGSLSSCDWIDGPQWSKEGNIICWDFSIWFTLPFKLYGSKKKHFLSLHYLTWAKIFLGLFSGKAKENHFMEITPIFISFKSLFEVVMYSPRHGHQPMWVLAQRAEQWNLFLAFISPLRKAVTPIPRKLIRYLQV